jgi:hypothetical protein
MAALIAIGALSYFGFTNPQTFLPDKCDFGKQLECTDYLIQGPEIKIMLRNNFGKEIEITDARGLNIDPVSALPLVIEVGSEAELELLKSGAPFSKGEKADLLINVTFQRSGAGNPEHSLIGTLFSSVQ